MSHILLIALCQDQLTTNHLGHFLTVNTATTPTASVTSGNAGLILVHGAPVPYVWCMVHQYHVFGAWCTNVYVHESPVVCARCKSALWLVHWCTSACGWCMVHQCLWLVHGAPVPVVGTWCTSALWLVHCALVNQYPVIGTWSTDAPVPVVRAWRTSALWLVLGPPVPVLGAPMPCGWCMMHQCLWLVLGAPVPVVCTWCTSACGWCLVHQCLWLVHGAPVRVVGAWCTSACGWCLVHQCLWLAAVVVSCTDLTDYPGHEALTAALERSLLRCLHGLFRGVSCKLNLLSVWYSITLIFTVNKTYRLDSFITDA